MQAGSTALSSRAARGAPLAAARPLGRSGRCLAVSVRADSCLIVNTKGGGHAFLGLHLAKKLLAGGHQVTILNDGDEAKLSQKAPFSEYRHLWGAQVVFADPTDPATYPEGYFDVVYDNNGKDLKTCKPLIDHFRGRVRHYVFVGSAGAYEANSVEPMHVEGDKRKASAGHVEVERYLDDLFMPYTVFQPLYIYGPHTAKDCEQWFLDRIMRDRPVPIPAPGIQLTSLSHVEDLADMMARVPGNYAAVREHFNLASDRCISFDGIVRALAKAAGKEARIVHYDPKAVKLEKGQGFPFRAVHFFASADKAKRVLGWQPQHDFLRDADQLVREYRSSGRLDRQVDFSADDLILAAAKGGSAAAPAGAAASSGPGLQELVASGVITRQEAASFSQQQLEFLARKRGGQPRAAPAAGAAAGGSAFAAAAGNGAIKDYLAKGLISQQEANTFSLEQLEFLARKRATVRA